MNDPTARHAGTSQESPRVFSAIPLPSVGPPLIGASRPPREPCIPFITPPPIPQPAAQAMAQRIPAPQMATQALSPAQAPSVAGRQYVPLQSATPPIPWWERERLFIRFGLALGGLFLVIGTMLLLRDVIDLRDIPSWARVMIATAMGIILLFVSVWIRPRKVHPTASDSTLFASSAILATVVLVVTFYYEWWPTWFGALALLPLIIGYFIMARIWNSQQTLLIQGIVFFLATLYFQVSSVNTSLFPGALVGLTMLAFAFRKQWHVVNSSATVMTVLGVLLGDLLGDFSGTQSTGTAPLIVGSALILLGLTHIRNPLTTREFQLYGIVAPAIMMIISWSATTTPWGWWISFFACVVWVAVAQFTHQTTARYSEMTALSIMPLTLALASANATSETLPSAIMVPWIFLIIMAAVIVWLTEQRHHWGVWAVWALTSLYIVSPMHSSVFLKKPLWLTSINSLTIALLLAVVLAAAMWRRKAIILLPKPAVLGLSILGLHYSTLAVVTMFTFVGSIIATSAGMKLGYLFGHALVSIGWISASGWILLKKTNLSSRAELAIGVTLAISGVTKLVFLDMGTLTGIPRMAAFLVSGIAMIVIATKRAKLVDAPAPPRLPTVPPAAMQPPTASYIAPPGIPSHPEPNSNKEG